MASRREICSGCWRQMLVPSDVFTFQCSACRAVCRVRQSDPWCRVYDSVVYRPAGGFYNLVNAVAGSGMAYPGSGTYAYGNGNNYNYIEHPRPSLPPPPAFGRKRALLCGVSYYHTSYQLKGSINDVNRMKFLLVERLGFPSDCVLTLTEEEPKWKPTKNNIRLAITWLVQGCRPGDSLVFYFSGHGKKQRDYNNDELDGFDEALCPLDHETEGLIIDDEINSTMVRPLPQGAKMHAIVDSCYSGTILDLPFVCRMNGEGYYFWEDQKRSAAYKGTSGGLALCLSACDDDQNSASTSAFTGKVMGALTFGFTQAISNEPGLTYGRLLSAMKYAISRSNGTDALQEPQLSSSMRFNIHSEQVIL